MQHLEKLNNKIYNFYNGIYCKLNFLSDSILRNYIRPRCIGINIYGDSGVVRQNLIDSASGITGINLIGNNLKIIQNKILSLTQSKGINVFGTKHLIANNFINIGGLGVAEGIVINSVSENLNIIHNSINITSTDFINGKAINIGGGNNHIIKNNIFCNNGNGFASYLTQLPQNTSWDYNVYYSPLKKIAWYNNISYDSLQLWAGVINGDANSMFINPYYVSEINLRPNQRFINGAGLMHPEVLVDIYDILRNLSAPDIGAVEFKVDFGVTELINPTLACLHNPDDTIKIYLKQYGDVPFTDITLAYQVNNGVIVFDTIHGSISNDIVHIFPVTVNLTSTGTYIFKIWLTSNFDDNPNNDTLIVIRYSDIPPQITNFIVPNTCEGNPTFFNSNATINLPHTISNYIWEFGNGDSAYIKNPTYIYDSIGAYNVILKVFSSIGCYKDTSKILNIYGTPKALYTTSPTCNGFPVIFNNLTTISSQDSIFYVWDFGDNSFTTIQNPTHNYSSNGIYQSSLITYTNKGCADTTTKTIQMHPTPVLTLLTQNSICGLPNGFIHSQVNSGTPPFTYLWSNGYNTPNLDNLLQGNFVLTVTDTNECKTMDSASIVSPVQPLQVQFNSNIFICENSSNGWIKAFVTGGNQPYLFNWSNGSIQDSISQLSPGIYVLTINDLTNCALTDSLTLYETFNPVVQTTVNDVLCFGENTGNALAIALNGIAPLTYQWSTTPPQTTDLASSLSAGIYIVTVIDNAGCIGYDTLTIKQPDSFNVVTTYIHPLCNTSSDGSITANVTGATPPYNYLWNTTPPQNTSVATNLPEGIYFLTITDANGCNTNTSSITLTGQNQIHAAFIASPNLGYYPINIQFVFTGSGATTYNWDFGDGNNSTSQNPSNTYTSSNNFLVFLTINSGVPYYCTDTASMYLIIDKPSEITVPNVFTPNNDGINDYFEIVSTNISEIETVIYNRWGKEIFKSNYTQTFWDGNINNEPAPEGTYFYLIKAKGKDVKEYNLHGSISLLR